MWCNTRPPGTVISNPRTDRIRKIVVESGAKNLKQWLDYERNIRADFEKAFGEPPGALVGIGIMIDTDNTHSMANAWYGPLRLARQWVSRALPGPVESTHQIEPTFDFLYAVIQPVIANALSGDFRIQVA